eukprot:6212680-Pleurochrysis_carterae.AAC.1
MPLASVVTVSVPVSSVAANVSRGASSTPSFSSSSADAASSSSSHSARALPPLRSGNHSSPPRQPPRPPWPCGALTTAKPPRRGRFSSGATCERFTSRPTSVRALLQCTRMSEERTLALGASQSPGCCAEAEAQRGHRVARYNLCGRRMKSEFREAQHCELRVDVCPRGRSRGRAARRRGVQRVESQPGHRRWRFDGVVDGHAREVVDVDLKVAWRQLPGAALQGSRPLRRRASLRPAPRRGREGLRRIEGRLLPLHPRCDERRDAFEAVGGEGAPKAHPTVHDHRRASVRPPPHEALCPQVCPLDGAEPVCGLRVDDVGDRAHASLVGVPCVAVRPRVDDGQRLGQRLDARERDDTLGVGDASVDGVCAAEARVRRHSRLGVVLDAHGAVGLPRCLLPRLQNDVAGLQPARHERQVSGWRRRPALAHVGVDRLGRRRRLLDEAGVVERENGDEFAL